MSSARVFVSSYVLQHGSQSVGFTVRSVEDGDKRVSKLIGYNPRPDFAKYSKFIQTVGSDGLDGVILPDVNLLVELEEFMSGIVNGIEVQRSVRLYKKYVAMRDGKSISVFSLEKVSFQRDNANFNIDVLKAQIGAIGWTEASRNRISTASKAPTSAKTDNKKGEGKKANVNPSVNEVKRIVREVKNPRPIVQRELPPVQWIEADGVEYSEIKGNLFNAKDGMIVNCISADVEMRRGIAKSFVKLFPEDVNDCYRRDISTG